MDNPVSQRHHLSIWRRRRALEVHGGTGGGANRPTTSAFEIQTAGVYKNLLFKHVLQLLMSLGRMSFASVGEHWSGLWGCGHVCVLMLPRSSNNLPVQIQVPVQCTTSRGHTDVTTGFPPTRIDVVHFAWIRILKEGGHL